MRFLDIGSRRFTEIAVMDEPGQGGACHKYYIGRVSEVPAPKGSEPVPVGEFGHVHFQDGPVNEYGVNGCHQEDLIAIVIDRLRHFQAGKFSCRENALALTKLEEAMHWLNHRTKERSKRGVEGTNVV